MDTVKKLLSVIQDLNVGMLGFRHALMNVKAQDLPVTADYLRDVDANIRKDPRIKAGFEAIERFSTVMEIHEFLKKFQGPIQ